jgi:hypothetical protein
LSDTKRIGFCDSVTCLDRCGCRFDSRTVEFIDQDGSALSFLQPQDRVPVCRGMHVSGGASQPPHRCPELDWIYWFCAAGRRLPSCACMMQRRSARLLELLGEGGREAVSCVAVDAGGGSAYFFLSSPGRASVDDPAIQRRGVARGATSSPPPRETRGTRAKNRGGEIGLGGLVPSFVFCARSTGVERHEAGGGQPAWSLEFVNPQGLIEKLARLDPNRGNSIFGLPGGGILAPG